MRLERGGSGGRLHVLGRQSPRKQAGQPEEHGHHPRLAPRIAPARDADGSAFRASRFAAPGPRRRMGPGRQSVAVGGSLYARPDERHEELCAAVRARRADAGRRGRQGSRIPFCGFSVGDTVFHMLGWREAAAGPRRVQQVPGLPSRTIMLGNTAARATPIRMSTWPRQRPRYRLRLAAAGAVGRRCADRQGEGSVMCPPRRRKRPCKRMGRRRGGLQGRADRRPSIAAAPNGMTSYRQCRGDHLDRGVDAAASIALRQLRDDRDYKEGSTTPFRYVPHIGSRSCSRA